MRYPEPKPVVKTPGLSEKAIDELMEVMGNIDGVTYVSATWLRFSRPAVCLTGNHGEQKTVTVDNAKVILKENARG